MCRIFQLIFIGALLSACSKFESLQEKSLNPSKQSELYEIKYGNNIFQTMNIVLPANRSEQTPVVVFIHGGAWLFGDKSVHEKEIKLLAGAGIAAATINYRFASDVEHIRYDDLVNDVRLSVDYIASKSAVWQVSANRFGVAGQSAGGHLALSTAFSKNDDKRIKACVSWAGPANLIDPEQANIAGGKEVAKVLVGHSLKTTDDTLAYKHASPFWNIKSDNPPTLLIQGTKDIAVPYQSIVRFHDKLKESASSQEMLTFEGDGHLWTGSRLDKARQKTIDWFKKYL